VWVSSGQPTVTAAVAALQPGGAHQPGDALAAHTDAVVQAQLGVDAWDAVGGPAALMDGPDLGGQGLVGDGPRCRRPGLPGVEARARHTQHAAQQGDSVVCLLLVDQPEDHRR
jgi:hypothetical protein